MAVAWHACSSEEALERLTASRDGLSESNARGRLEQSGENRLREPSRSSALRRLFAQFADVTVLALLVAAVVAVVVGMQEEGEWVERFGDAVAIGIIVALNAVIGFAQERRAEAALRALGEMTAPSATVKREARERVVPAAELVAGDVVLLSEGDRVPADVRLLEGHRLSTDESALTGESTPVDKASDAVVEADTPLAERKSMAFMGTHVTTGRALGLVVETGMNTELGRIAELLGSVEAPDTPLQRDLRRFGVWLVGGCVVIAGLVFAVGALRTDASISFLFMTAVSLAVAAIPEGLPAVTTIVLALGVERMARRRALVRRLAAVETLGAAQIICTDKTGTLTQNRMRVRRLAVIDRELEVSEAGGAEGSLGLSDDTGLVQVASLPGIAELIGACRHAPAAKIYTDADGVRVVGDPTDGALLLLANALAESEHDERVVSEHPFDARLKMASVTVERGRLRIAYSHGAPEIVAQSCQSVVDAAGAVVPLDERLRRAVMERVEKWAAQGLRVLALARGESEPDTLLGLVGISDPPRPEVSAAVDRARQAGVRTIMITGDHRKTAAAIGAEVGIDGRGVVTGAEIDDMSDSDLEDRVDSIDVVARATASHKLRVVRAWQTKGAVVAMTGDGVNDAPALKAATIGVAMGRGGTDVAREAADLVLADDNYATIVTAIEEGRIIFSNIKKFILFLLSINAGLVIAVFVAAVLGLPAILTPTQILWINLVTNGLPALALGMENVHLDHMRDPPRSPEAGLLSPAEVSWIVAYGMWMAALGLGVFLAVLERDGDLSRARSLAFTVLAVGPLFHALTCRAKRRSIFSLGPFSNRALDGALLTALAFQAIALYVPGLRAVFHTVPLAAGDLAVALAISSAVLVVGELEKAVRRTRADASAR